MNTAAGSRRLGAANKGALRLPGCPQRVTCTKRRIRCDLAQPTCKKCAKKGLACPGYGPRLRWAGGVAVRGKLKGQNVPLPDRTDRPEQDAVLADAAGAEAEAEAEREAEAEAAAEPRQGPSVQDGVIVSPAGLDQTLRKSAREFIKYYDKNIAGLMVWFDSEDNDYRRRVLPLAANTPGLRLAVAAISAHHGAGTFDHETPRFSEAARDACLGLIQIQVREMTGRLTGGSELTSQSDMADAEWMLAAILMISTYEMANAQTAAAESHRIAARTIANVFGHNEASCTRVFDFLRNQLAVLDVLSSTTSFQLSDVQRTVLPPPSMANGLFTQYLTLLQRVTLLSRQRIEAPSPDANIGSSGVGDLTASSIRSQFEQARGATLLAAGRLQMQPSVVGRDFIRLVDIYHHAGILYSYR
ncbi:hypothetical protein TOPH_08054 [Tolypocladium ophioglossoides CBS 100239]|uniref:Zn(2)-C6 fungal-type domain-containing protein n=1 Tax=Tolypocladium ophioglossoides (strain CBS 100239) TaxID=1163406 RepID=A0A0L0MZS4_TOLOC|nr:hypothetical protein TOPH_08054 [Tolypocladium ophioglossoides CBS 100239]